MSITSDHICKRCGVILKGFNTCPVFCPKCGGMEVLEIGEEGSYDIKQLRKKHKIPFQREIYYNKTQS